MSNLDIHKETEEEILARMVARHEELTGTALGLADEKRMIYSAIAYGLFVRNTATNKGLKMNFVRYTEGDYATEIGAFTDTERLETKASSAPLKIEIESGLTQLLAVPPTRFTPGNNVYFITPYMEFQVGETSKELTATCTQIGTVGDGFLPGEINKIVDPFPNFKSVTNLEISQGGAEVEGDSGLIERIREAPSKFSTAGPGDGYIYWAKTANQNIIDVNAKMTTPGTVTITPLMKGGELPTDSILEEVMEVCNDKKKRPLTDNLVVAKPTQITYDIDFTYYISSSDVTNVNDIKAKVDSAVEAYKAWQKGALKRDINPTELNFLVRQAGVKRVVITSPLYQQVDDFQVAKEVNITVTYGGLEDD